MGHSVLLALGGSGQRVGEAYLYLVASGVVGHDPQLLQSFDPDERVLAGRNLREQLRRYATLEDGLRGAGGQLPGRA